MMALPEELETSFESTIREYEEQEKMPYVTSVERSGMKRALINVLEGRFETVPDTLKERIAAIQDGQLLDDLTRRVGTVGSPAELEAMLPRSPEAGAVTENARR